MTLLSRVSSKFALAAIGLILLTVITRLPALLHPWTIDDETVYSIVANEIVEGGRPYIDAVERKPPLLFWLYAGVTEVTGKFRPAGVHLAAVAWTLATMAGLYVTGRQLFDRQTGLMAALLYCVYQPWGTFKNLAFNGELIMNLPLICAYGIVLARSASRRRPALLLAGAFLAMAFLFKQPAAIAAVPLGIYLLLPGYRTSRGLNLADSISQVCLLTAGFLGVLTLVALILLKQGILGDAFFWTITAHGIRHVFVTNAILNTLAFAGCCLPLWFGAMMALRHKSQLWAEKNAEWTALVLLLLASVIGTVAGGRFYPHYYIQLVLPLALLAAPYYLSLWRRRVSMPHWLLAPAFLCLVLAITVVAFFSLDSVELASERQASAPGQYLCENSTPDDRIFVWGHAPRIYLEARRRPACRYILTFPLTGRIFGGRLPGVDTHNWILPGAWDTLEKDFAKHPPVYIVDVEHGPKEQYPVRDFPLLAHLLEEHYQPILEQKSGVIYRLRSPGKG